jgi:hypothetical protein
VQCLSDRVAVCPASSHLEIVVVRCGGSQPVLYYPQARTIRFLWKDFYNDLPEKYKTHMPKEATLQCKVATLNLPCAQPWQTVLFLFLLLYLFSPCPRPAEQAPHAVGHFLMKRLIILTRCGPPHAGEQERRREQRFSANVPLHRLFCRPGHRRATEKVG